MITKKLTFEGRELGQEIGLFGFFIAIILFPGVAEVCLHHALHVVCYTHGQLFQLKAKHQRITTKAALAKCETQNLVKVSLLCDCWNKNGFDLVSHA